VLENLSHKLRKGSMTPNQLMTRLNRFLKDVRGKQTDLAHALGARLTAAKIEEMSVSNIPTFQNLSVQNLKKLKRLLTQLPNNRIPDAINRDIESLLELHRLEKLLSQLLDDVREDTDGLAKSDRHPNRRSQDINELENAGSDSQRTPDSGNASGTVPDRAVTAQRPGVHLSSGEDRDLQKQFESDDGYSSPAGGEKSSGKKKSGTEIEKSPGPGIQDKMISSQMQNYLIHIRSLTAVGESRMEAEDIIRDYQQEIEGVLQKEDIPINYREYIKNYFISIGLKREENAHEFK
jgi:hypothetical protein